MEQSSWNYCKSLLIREYLNITLIREVERTRKFLAINVHVMIISEKFFNSDNNVLWIF